MLQRTREDEEMQPRFVASANRADGLPDLGLVEIAFAGRSNVGKSSLLGALMRQPDLVRTSRTPGRTQALNLFAAGELALVDLPGYGYAKLSKSERAGLDKLLRSYLLERETLAGVVLLVDARREEVSDLDRKFVRMVIECPRRLLVVINKADLVPKPRRRHVTILIEDGLDIPRGSSLLCSATTGEGLRELDAALHELSRDARDDGDGDGGEG
jgi:GTP-binding protein